MLNLSLMLLQISSPPTHTHISVEDHTSEIIWAAQIGLVGF